MTRLETRRAFAASEIARTAMALFAERGFHAVTVEEIAEAAEISPRTFFRYFPAKEDVVLLEQRRMQERLVDAFTARPTEEPPITALRNAYLATSDVPANRRKAVLQHNRVRLDVPAILARGYGEDVFGNDAIVDALASRMGVDSVHDSRPAIAAAVMAAAAATAFDRWLRTTGRGNPADAVGVALAMVESGLRSMDTPSD
ncbi:MAG: TetR family transcriptional regulator [Actinobacteria bacterium]|nr:TetR family transcriptional regulator [Actinomycetota bacterium]MSW78023.1 TetR family transcriptional regulator [Actinomycetota bacterium]MSX55170.1 TetR family transcriptional regulator [Actinomycetota bacterium]MSX92528.1 TetR family transcriptional regulator [Actinomycetota bacterium]MSZ83221.1 TetR family transcriptional regulator [Actinomycetota bacterium]